MMQDTRAVFMILIIAVCTFITRLVPFALFSGKGEPAPVIRFLGKALPAAVMGILIIYCVRNVSLTNINTLLPQLIAIAAVALLHIWKRNNLLSIGAGTLLYMLLVQFIF